MSIHFEFNNNPNTRQIPFLSFFGKIISRKTNKKTEKQGEAYSKITKGGQRVSRDSMEKYVTKGECTVLDSAIFTLNLKLFQSFCLTYESQRLRNTKPFL